jgi:hypothetical protein
MPWTEVPRFSLSMIKPVSRSPAFPIHGLIHLPHANDGHDLPDPIPITPISSAISDAVFDDDKIFTRPSLCVSRPAPGCRGMSQDPQVLARAHPCHIGLSRGMSSLHMNPAVNQQKPRLGRIGSLWWTCREAWDCTCALLRQADLCFAVPFTRSEDERLSLCIAIVQRVIWNDHGSDNNSQMSPRLEVLMKCYSDKKRVLRQLCSFEAGVNSWIVTSWKHIPSHQFGTTKIYNSMDPDPPWIGKWEAVGISRTDEWSIFPWRGCNSRLRTNIGNHRGCDDKKESTDLGESSESISTITVMIKDGKARHMRCIWLFHQSSEKNNRSNGDRLVFQKSWQLHLHESITCSSFAWKGQ